jgi:primosomal protein N' (replication factor Y) (superfamily II helicase)
VANTRPLRLKSETAKRSDRQAARVDPVVEVWVDNSIPHLDGLFDYRIPSRLEEQVKAGMRISVDFSGREVEALVIRRTTKPSTGGLKFISKVLSPHIVAPAGLIMLIEQACKRWLGHPYDFIRGAIPPQIASVDKSFSQSALDIGDFKNQSPSRTFIHLQPHEDALAKLAEFATARAMKGSVLVIVPEDRELQRLFNILDGRACVLTASLSRSERYGNYLLSLAGANQIFIGTRSGIFSYPPDLKTLIIYREGAESHYEPRFPGWNVRDLALLRAESEPLDLFFIGYVPCTETAVLLESGKMKLLAKSNHLCVSNFEAANGELLPGRIFAAIRKALKTGPVLFLVPRKGYASSLMCKKCRNIAACDCGGKISRRKSNAAAECVHCSKRFAQLKCKWCQSDFFILLGRGGERHLEEIGRAFPGFPIIYSTADAPISEVESKSSLVVATSGMEPLVPGGYSAVVLLEGDSFFSFSDLRAQERAREAFFAAASLVAVNGEIVAVVNSANPIVAALSKWDPKTLTRRELEQRKEVALPPFSRALYLDVESTEATAIVNGLRKALFDQRLPKSSRIMGPSQQKSGISRILLTADVEDSEDFLKFLSEYLRHRAISKKKSVSIRVDPYSLS